MGIVQKGVWWAADYLYAARAQLRALDPRVTPEAFRSGDRRPVLVIPGVYEPWRFMLPLIRTLHGDGHPVHVVDPLRANRRPVADGAAAVSRYLAATGLDDVVIVAHSKGGLIGKHVMALDAEGHRVRAMAAIATPFGGSALARYQFSRTLRAFSPRDATLRRLGAEREVNRRVVSIFADFDPHIPEGSELAGARNVRLATGGHFRILAHPETLRVVREVVGATADPDGFPAHDEAPPHDSGRTEHS